jgi:hypothetical protein
MTYTDKLERMAAVGGIALASSLIALFLGYFRLRAGHHPFTPRQRRMWRYYWLFLCALPVLGELHMALTFWVMPMQYSTVVVIFLLLVWMIVCFLVVAPHES